MARKKRKKKRGKRSGGLFGTPQNATAKSTYMGTVKEGAIMLLAAIAASGAGAVIGKHSLIAGIPVALVGVHKKNKYIIAAGLGLTLSNGFQRPGKTSTTQGFDGFDMKQMAAEAKDRVGTFFKNFGQKLYLPVGKNTGEDYTTNGLGEGVKYFVNPHSVKDLDMSAIDRIQEQIAQMNQSGGDIEREL